MLHVLTWWPRVRMILGGLWTRRRAGLTAGEGRRQWPEESARVVVIAVAAAATVLGFPALSGARPRPLSCGRASRSRRPSMRQHRGTSFWSSRAATPSRECLPGQSGADVRGGDHQGRHQPDRPDARTAPGCLGESGRAGRRHPGRQDRRSGLPERSPPRESRVPWSGASPYPASAWTASTWCARTAGG